jgi:hypothetical protein
VKNKRNLNKEINSDIVPLFFKEGQGEITKTTLILLQGK